MKREIYFVALIFILIVQVSWAHIPKQISYQGVLTDTGGNPVPDDTYSLTFTIYDAATGGVPLWTETQGSVATSSGVFNVILGSVDDLDIEFDKPYWLGVKIGTGAELVPRTPLTAAPYSLGGNWKLTGNAGTDPTANFLGTTDYKALELRVFNARVLRLEPNSSATPCIIGGHSSNWISTGVSGGTIGGGGGSGGPNRVTDNSGTVAGGLDNQAGDGDGATLNSLGATVGGGWQNAATEDYSTVGGGSGNTASGGNSTVGGGIGNTASGYRSTVPGGSENVADGSYSLAAGRLAKALNQGCFVWGDSTDEDIASTGDNQFIARANGGVKFIYGTGALRLEPYSYGPNIVAGYSGNSIAPFVNCGTISGGGRSGQENMVTSPYGTVGGGVGNWAGDDDATFDDAVNCTVSGGQNNRTGHHFASIGGGASNEVNGYAGTIPGGYHNEALGQYAVVGGGKWNQANADYATIAGGGRADLGTPDIGNRVTDKYGTIGGGGSNRAGSDDANPENSIYATVSGGERNEAHGSHSTVGGGWNNKADEDCTTVGGGRDNVADEGHSTVGGGQNNFADGDWAVIGGGQNNGIYGSYSTVGGGRDNTANARYATIAGGGTSVPGDPTTGNRVTDNYSTVGGGGNNQAGSDDADPEDARYATISGGEDNNASGSHCTIGGGRMNIATGNDTTVAGGYRNTADGHYNAVGGGGLNGATSYYSTVPGGYANEAIGWCSFAAGMRAKAKHNGAFVWADSSNLYDGFDFKSEADNEFAVRCTGGARFVTGIDGSGDPKTGVTLDSGANAWDTLSDRDAKTNFSHVDVRDVLERLTSIPVETWNYKSQEPSIRHMGPMAQDFYAAFGLGRDDKHISTIDPDGVALAAIQGLYELVKEKDAENAVLKQRLDSLEARLKVLESLISPQEGVQR